MCHRALPDDALCLPNGWCSAETESGMVVDPTVSSRREKSTVSDFGTPGTRSNGASRLDCR